MPLNFVYHENGIEGVVLSLARMKRRFAFFAALFLLGHTVFAFDEAERLSRKVPGQAYRALDDYALLEEGDIRWGIPLWSCTPGDLKIIKVLGKNPAAPYAVEITVAPNERIDGSPDTLRRLRSIHLLALSLDDALKIRRALIAETEGMRRFIEKRQGNPPGYLKRVVDARTVSGGRRQMRPYSRLGHLLEFARTGGIA